MADIDETLRQLLLTASGQSEPRPEPPPHPAPPNAVSLMITNRQRAQLRELGYTDAAIQEMTPADAHQALGLR